MSFILALFWFVQFTDKLGSAPIQFSDRATENRLLWSIPTDSLDYAVVPEYINGVRATGARVCHVSRWMNGLTMEADSATMLAVKNLPCVRSVELTRDETAPSASISPRKMALENTSDPYQDNAKQLDVFNLRPLHQMGYEGQGIRMAVIDGGFCNVDTAACLSYVRDRIIGMYSFSADTSSFFSTEGSHGAHCLTFIAAKTDTYHGAAVEAEYVLIRSEEMRTESPKEMDNLVAALELCDSLGVNVVSCSLGYRLFDNPTFNFSHDKVDGKTFRASRAAAIAAKKGILCCFSAGNDGNREWHNIGVPTDADSILSVGAVCADSTIAPFSSYGPSADGRVKPEVSAVGSAAVYVNTQTGKAQAGNGTSFSTPLVAGLAASLWSAMPQVPAQQIRERIIRSAHLYPSYDPLYQMGYGIPDAVKAYEDIPSSLIKHPTKSPIYKVLHNGQIVIYNNGRLYNLMGLTF
ncbi:MAG: S8 family serine peptidase [Paludibacteraceae bacterium]|nr:S8 family serine peptidase [Paludibacteraceae bacterium]